MTARYHSLTLILAEDTREDDAEALIEALKQFRGVIDVVGNVSGFETRIAYARARTELRARLFAALDDFT